QHRQEPCAVDLSQAGRRLPRRRGAPRARARPALSRFHPGRTSRWPMTGHPTRPDAAPMNRIRTQRRWVALGVLAVAQFMVFLDESIVNVALPSIKADLGYSQAGLAWVINAYILAFGGLVLLGGRPAHLLGRRRVLLAAGALLWAR